MGRLFWGMCRLLGGFGVELSIDIYLLVYLFSCIHLGARALIPLPCVTRFRQATLVMRMMGTGAPTLVSRRRSLIAVDSMAVHILWKLRLSRDYSSVPLWLKCYIQL